MDDRAESYSAAVAMPERTSAGPCALPSFKALPSRDTRDHLTGNAAGDACRADVGPAAVHRLTPALGGPAVGPWHVGGRVSRHRERRRDDCEPDEPSHDLVGLARQRQRRNTRRAQALRMHVGRRVSALDLN